MPGLEGDGGDSPLLRGCGEQGIGKGSGRARVRRRRTRDCWYTESRHQGGLIWEVSLRRGGKPEKERRREGCELRHIRGGLLAGLKAVEESLCSDFMARKS